MKADDRSMGRWRVVGASVQGESHRKKGQPCQDAHQWRELGGGILVAAVADGAGTADCSEIGSALAAESAVAAAAVLLNDRTPGTDEEWYAVLQHIFILARESLVAGADELGLPLPHLATTLLVAVATPDRLAAGQVGDGAVVARGSDPVFQAFTRPIMVEQEYVNETNFLTSPSYKEHTQLLVQSMAVTGLALISDGLQMLALKMPQASPHQAFFAPLLQLLSAAPQRDRAEAQLRTFLLSPAVTQRATDDLTLVLAVRD